jgi:hypothetical protein
MDGPVVVSLAALFALVVVFAISHKTQIKARLRQTGFDLDTCPGASPGVGPEEGQAERGGE